MDAEDADDRNVNDGDADDLLQSTQSSLPSFSSENSWRSRARCRLLVELGHYTQREMYDLFFPTRTSPPAWITTAKQICLLCPVREECLAEAIGFNQYRWGILGGLTAEDRRRMVSKRRREYAEAHRAQNKPPSNNPPHKPATENPPVDSSTTFTPDPDQC